MPPAQPVVPLQSHCLSRSPTPHLPDSLTACFIPRHCGCDPCILAYLEAVTGRGPQDARLQTLACSLDPNGEGPQATVDLDTFLVIMRDWIAACQRDGWVPAPPPSPRKPFLRSNLIPAYCSQHPLGTATCCSWKGAEEERKVEMGLGGGSEDKVPEIGRQRESGGRNKMGWKEEKGDCYKGLTEACPHPSSKPSPCPSCFSIWPRALAIWPHLPPHGAHSHLTCPLPPPAIPLPVAGQEWAGCCREL